MRLLFFLLATFMIGTRSNQVDVFNFDWPPGLLPSSALLSPSWAELLPSIYQGFTIHGWWPPYGTPPNLKATLNFTALSMNPDLFEALMFYWPGINYTKQGGNEIAYSNITNSESFWAHEWTTHGENVSGNNQSYFFETALALRERFDPTPALLNSVLPLSAPSSSAYSIYSYEQLSGPISAYFNIPNDTFLLCCTTQNLPSYAQDALSVHSSDPTYHNVLVEVSFCIDHETFISVPCANGTTNVCPSWFVVPALLPTSPHLWSVWMILAVTTSSIGGLTLLAIVIIVFFRKRNTCCLSPFKIAPKYQTVLHPWVRRPVELHISVIDPHFQSAMRPFLDDLRLKCDVGTGFKGGIARKVMKELFGQPEPGSSFDIDLLVLLDRATLSRMQPHGTAPTNMSSVPKDLEDIVRKRLAGQSLGDVVIQPKDVEVKMRSELREYFISRDITMNEVWLGKLDESPNLYLIFTNWAKADVIYSRIRPSVHQLHSSFTFAWLCDKETGSPYIGSSNIVRSIIRYLKGHGSHYCFDKYTWDYYRTRKLAEIDLFRILRPFHADDAQFNAAVEHLLQIGFLDPKLLRQAGSPNQLWGELFFRVNQKLAACGRRFTFSELNADEVAAWILNKRFSVERLREQQLLKRLGRGFVESDADVLSLGLFSLPQELERWIEGDHVDHPFSEVQTRRVPPLQQEDLRANTPTPLRVSSLSSDETHQPASPRSVVALSEVSSAYCLVDEDEGKDVPENKSAHCGSISGIPVSHPHHGLSSSSSNLTVLEDENLTRIPVSNRSAKSLTDPAQDHEDWTENPQITAETTITVEMLCQNDFLDKAIIEEEGVVTQGRSSDPSLLQKVSTKRLFLFVFGLMYTHWALFALALVLLLATMVMQLLSLTLKGQLLDAFTLQSSDDFWPALQQLLIVSVAQAVLSTAANLVVDFQSQRVMNDLFDRLYEKLTQQPLSFYEDKRMGELVSKTSADSLNMRLIFSTYPYDLLVGVVTILVCGVILSSSSVLGSVASSSNALPYVIAIICLLATTVGVTSVGGHYLRLLNRDARSRIGRLFGFTTDSFFHMGIIYTYGLQLSRILHYRIISRNYFTVARNLDVASNLLTSFISTVDIIITVLLFIAGWYVGSLTSGQMYSIISYFAFLLLGVSKIAGSFMGCMEHIGSLERVVKLFDSCSCTGVVRKNKAHYASQNPRRYSGCGEMLSFPQAAPLLVPTWFVSAIPHRSPLRLELRDINAVLGKKVVLENVCIELRPGDLSVVVGESGSGKTMLIRIISLLATPLSGSVVYFETDLQGPKAAPAVSWREIAQADPDELHFLRQRIGVVSTFCSGWLTETIFFNLVVARFAVTEQPVALKDVQNVCKLVGVHDEILRLPNGYSTVMMHDGYNLPHYTLQLLSLARVLLREPRVLLLDDFDLHFSSAQRQALYDLLCLLASHHGCAILLTSCVTLDSEAFPSFQCYQLAKGKLQLIRA